MGGLQRRHHETVMFGGRILSLRHLGFADGELKIHESPQAVEEETLTLLHLPLLCRRGGGVMGGQGCPTSPRQRRS